jgi:prophage antirepressor-like protein
MNKPNHSVAKVFRFEDKDSGRYWLVKVVGTSEMPEWVFSDVIPILYPNLDKDEYSTCLAQIPSVWKSQKKIVTSEGEQIVSTVYESGLNYLIAKSDSSLMICFQQWVEQEILPTIRSNNNYLIFNQSLTINSNTKEKLETIRLGMDLLYELGGVDEYMRLILREKVRDILLEDAKDVRKDFTQMNADYQSNNSFKTLEEFQVIANGSSNGDLLGRNS